MASDFDLDVTDPEIQNLLRYANLSSEDLHTLREHRSLSELADGVADNFYGHIMQFPELRDIIEQHSSIDRLSRTLTSYFRTLFAGAYNDKVVAGRLRIGVVHDRISLPLGAYLGAWLTIDEMVIKEILKLEDPLPVLLSWRRVTQADTMLVAQSFIDARDREVRALLGSVERVQEQMETLSQQGRQIEQVVDAIEDVAEQTKLLSLNARIEAAHAGDHGRGFSVVAEEVRRLADKTAESLQQILDLNESSGAALAAVSEAMEEALQHVNSLSGESISQEA